jgi:hypothetical protein
MRPITNRWKQKLSSTTKTNRNIYNKKIKEQKHKQTQNNLENILHTIINEPVAYTNELKSQSDLKKPEKEPRTKTYKIKLIK